MGKTISHHHPLHRKATKTPHLLKAFMLFFLLPHCASAPPPSLLPASESDLNLLGKATLCQTKAEAQTSWLQPGVHESPWGGGIEVFQEITSPNKQAQWFMFNEDQTLVGVITVFPHGLSLKDYPKLRHTLSQLPPAREFFFHSSQLLKEQAPDSGTLHRTGEATTTHQYFMRHTKENQDQLVMAVFVLDPYETLLDGSHPKFLSYIEDPDHPEKDLTGASGTLESEKEFLGLQQFARGEISLFASCGHKQPEMALDAYQKAIQYGLSDPKQLAEAHHRLGLALRSVGRLPEATTTLEQALTIQPHSAVILNSYGSVLAQLGKLPQAIEAYERALALQPNYAQARFNLAESYETHNPKRAIQEYETFLILAEDNPEESTKVGLAKGRIKALQGGAKQ
ncbi:MAG: tetratricopeptide repeat protein [Nitrospirales bacterium]|nr:MAG: tetratricopeptide repeat protein [Nitrospirales bacterium]